MTPPSFIQLRRAFSNWSQDIRDTNADAPALIRNGDATREIIEEVIADARRAREAIRQELDYGRDLSEVLPILRP